MGPQPMRVREGGREFVILTAQDGPFWRAECRGQRETLTASARTVTDAVAAVRRQIADRLAAHRLRR